ncbi:MAG: TadE/TadG family type IV pilus assembly protein [Candidatus Sulfotelmatobacter sp.]
MARRSAYLPIRSQLPCAYKRRVPYSGRGKQGHSLVETALCMVLLFILVFGVIDLCLALYSYHSLSEVARDATRYAIVHGSASGNSNPNTVSTEVACPSASSDPTASTEYCTASAANIATYVAARYAQTLGKVTVTPTWSAVPLSWATSPPACAPSTSCNNPGNLVQVQVKYAFTPLGPFFPAVTMSSTSQMIISQ